MQAIISLKIYRQDYGKFVHQCSICICMCVLVELYLYLYCHIVIHPLNIWLTRLFHQPTHLFIRSKTQHHIRQSSLLHLLPLLKIPFWVPLCKMRFVYFIEKTNISLKKILQRIMTNLFINCLSVYACVYWLCYIYIYIYLLELHVLCLCELTTRK